MKTATTTKTKKKVITPTKPKVVEDPAAMPPQTEGPAMMVSPIISDLIDGPTLIDPELTTYTEYVKCEGPKGTRWVTIDKWNMDRYRYMYVDGVIRRMTLVNVTFKSQTVEEGMGCGVKPRNTLIGYVEGQKLMSGHVNPQAQTFIPKFDRATGRFMIDGLEVIGAKAMILGDNCIALIVDPIFKETK
jgi:hypothetical protein